MNQRVPGIRVKHDNWSHTKAVGLQQTEVFPQEIPQPSITNIGLKITYLKFHSNLPGTNESNVTCFFTAGYRSNTLSRSCLARQKTSQFVLALSGKVWQKSICLYMHIDGLVQEQDLCWSDIVQWHFNPKYCTMTFITLTSQWAR